MVQYLVQESNGNIGHISPSVGVREGLIDYEKSSAYFSILLFQLFFI
jgi:hypothetical protein